MRATNFSWRDAIRIRLGGEEFDLHNDFRFRQFTYDPAQQRLCLEWQPAHDDSKAQDQPTKVIFRLQGVTHFSFLPRDSELPFTEDDCLASFGYDNDEDWPEGQFWVDEQPADDWRWSFIFQSGAELRVSGATGSIEVCRD